MLLRALVLVSAQALPAASGSTLPALLAFSDRHAPAVQVALRRRELGGAARDAASPLLRENPSLELGAGPRRESAGESLDGYAALRQPVEIAGQRGLRLDAASRLEERLDAELDLARREARRDVTVAFAAAVVARQRAGLAARQGAFAARLLEVARRRQEAGDLATPDVLLAASDEARARQRILAAESELVAARLRLAEVTGWDVADPPEVPASLPEPAEVPSLEPLLAQAAERSPELRVRRAALREAHARVELAAREAWPTPVLGVQVSREGSARGDASDIVLGLVGIPLPLWRLDEGERARSRAEESVAGAEQLAAERSVRARVVAAHAAVVSAAARVALFTGPVSGGLEESLELLRRGLAAGEISVVEVSTAGARLLEASGDALAARLDHERALAELELAAGVELHREGP